MKVVLNSTAFTSNVSRKALNSPKQNNTGRNDQTSQIPYIGLGGNSKVLDSIPTLFRAILKGNVELVQKAYEKDGVKSVELNNRLFF
ncbi:MAG: hypothetical protein QNJ31_02240 [Candidatus Caenarcaniphilales bacterium]|nr:hypothetical protein [Candidatus Caenarcaniphilales bacterium]